MTWNNQYVRNIKEYISIFFILFSITLNGCFSDPTPNSSTKNNSQKNINGKSIKKTDEPNQKDKIEITTANEYEPSEIFEPTNLKGTIRFKLNCYETALKDLILIFGNKIIDGNVKYEKENGIHERRLRPRIKKNIIELGNLPSGDYFYVIKGPRVRNMLPRKIILPTEKGLTVEVGEFEAWKIFIMTDIPLSKLPLVANLKFPHNKKELIINRKYYDYFSVYIKDHKPLKFDFNSGGYSNSGAPHLEHVEGTLYIFNIKLNKPQ
ncbi:MAG: hypothetical protein COA79_14575 [Planctomycetota bacterium]|nr:MAG: hypothetical protein COA79_14575 [Planctomycetota bacterium]